MASRLSPLPLPQFYANDVGSEKRRTISGNIPYSSKKTKGRSKSDLAQNAHSVGYLFMHYPSLAQLNSSRWLSSRTLSTALSAYSDQTIIESGRPVASLHGHEMDYSRVNCLVWVLHESGRSFSLMIQSLELGRSGPELANAWVGVDVHGWHKRIACQVAIYALLTSAIEVELLLSHDRSNESSVRKILSPTIRLIGDYIENQLNMRHPNLVQWFKVVELPRISGFFIPLLRKWSMEYAGSGVAGIILAISCCAAVGKLGSAHLSGPLSDVTLEAILVELMELSHSLVSVDKLHHLATEAGFEQEFLSHFGKKALPSEEIEFWIGIVQKKLSLAFHRESVISGMQSFHYKVQEDCLAALGLFAFLGRSTRLCLSRMGIKDLDGQVKDFLSYLECGSIFIYPEFSSLSVYQLFMEVVTDEIGWLDFYAACTGNQGRRRSKHHTIQAETEIILHTIFTVCYDIFSGFAHFTRSTQQPLDANLLAFLLRSQSLLTDCLEVYRAAYDRSSETIRVSEVDPAPFVGVHSKRDTYATMEMQQKPNDLAARRHLREHGPKQRKESNPVRISLTQVDMQSSESKSIHESFLRKYSTNLITTSSDILMGTQLLFIDVSVALELILRQLQGHKVTKRERKKLKRTLADIASVIPITVLMLLPVSPLGHAAILAAINRCTPCLIPSPYSAERLDVVKQLKRTKKMEVHSLSNFEDPSFSTAL